MRTYSRQSHSAGPWDFERTPTGRIRIRRHRQGGVIWIRGQGIICSFLFQGEHGGRGERTALADAQLVCSAHHLRDLCRSLLTAASHGRDLSQILEDIQTTINS